MTDQPRSDFERFVLPRHQLSKIPGHVRAGRTRPEELIIGVATHKYAHVAVAVDLLGTRVADWQMPANREGSARLESWAGSLGPVVAWGIEGTGSYGVGLASFLRRTGHRIVEVNRGDRS